MAFKTVQGISASNRTFDQLPSNLSQGLEWVRNPAWLTLPSITSGDSKLIGLVAIYPDAGDSSNFLALSASGSYTVDWGDGVVESYSGGVSQHIYDYNNSNLNNTDGQVVFISGNLIQRNNHGYKIGMPIKFYNITSTSGISTSNVYYITNTSNDYFNVSLSTSGSNVSFSDGYGSILRYKQAIVNVIPQSGQNLTHIDLNIKYNQSGLQNYSTPWLDIKLSSPNLTTLKFTAYPTPIIYHDSLENIEILNFGNITNLSYLFANTRLYNATLLNTNKCTDTTGMFLNCSVLKKINSFNTDSVTTMANMFESCTDLTSVPDFNAPNLTNTSFMFNGCVSLKVSPKFIKSNIVTANAMFNNCSNLTSLSLFDTSNITSATGMFANCGSLTDIPNYNFGRASNTSSMFVNCYNLRFINPSILNISGAINANNMFRGCSNIENISNLNIRSATNISSMFSGCYNLSSISFSNTSKVTNIGGLFADCLSLTDVGLFDTSKVTDMSWMFYNCASLSSVPLFNTSSALIMNNMFQNCTKLTSIPLFNTYSVTGTLGMSSMFQGCSNLLSIPPFNITRVRNINSIFSNCINLKSVPVFNLFSGVSMNGSFGSCSSLESIIVSSSSTPPLSVNSAFSGCFSLNYISGLDLSNVTAANAVNVFLNCNSLANIHVSGCLVTHSIGNCKASKSMINQYIKNLVQPTGAAFLTLTGNWGGSRSYNRTISSVDRSNIVTCADTSSLASGMSMTGIGTSIQGRVVVSDVVADTITLSNHAFVSGMTLSFSSIGSTSIAFRIYYPVNITTNTFQLATTASGSPINLTGANSNMTLRYSTYISEITPSSITLDLPACSSITNGTWTFREIDPYPALHKNWGITY